MVVRFGSTISRPRTYAGSASATLGEPGQHLQPVDAGEDHVVCDEGNSEPDCRSSNPAVCLVFLLAQTMSHPDAPRTERDVAFSQLRTGPDGLYAAELVI